MKLKMLAAAAAMLAAVVSVPAQAGALAAGDLTVSGIGLVDAFGNAFTGTITILSENRTGNASSKFNNDNKSNSANSTTPGATVDVLNQCTGDCGAGTVALYGGNLENNFTTHLAPPPQANFALGDMFLSGSALLNPAAASGLTRANAAAMGPTNTGSANATIQNGVSLSATFVVGNTFTGSVVAFADAYVRAFVTDPPVTGQSESASGSINFQLTIADSNGNTVLLFNPSQLNRGLTVRTGAAVTDRLFSFNGLVASGLATFNAGEEYSLTISQASNAVISSIPEPASLGLLGVALVAAGAAARRTRKQA
jgi:hypothetical protein